MIAFERLGLEPDADEAQIRRAYARELRQARPDENPVAFQELNQAYRQCLAYAVRRASAGEDDGYDEDEDYGETPADALTMRVTPEALAAALALDRQLADGADGSASDAATPGLAIDGVENEDAEQRFYLDRDAFVAGLFDASSFGSAADVHRWLQAHPAFYAIGAREALAPQVLEALIDAPELPPRHLAALLHFFGLDEVGPERDWLWPRIAELQTRARLTPEHTAAANELFGQPKPIDETVEGGDGLEGWKIWLIIVAVIALIRGVASLVR